MNETTEAPLDKTAEEYRQKFVEFIELADAGDKDAYAELKSLLEKQPQVWQSLGDLGRRLILDGISRNTQGRQAFTHGLSAKVNQMRLQLGWDSSSCVEKLLIERVLITWLHVNWYDSVAQGIISLPAKSAQRQEKRLAAAHRLHRDAVVGLTEYRQLINKTTREKAGNRRGGIGKIDPVVQKSRRRAPAP